jgi:hypothetical protein
MNDSRSTCPARTTLINCLMIPYPTRFNESHLRQCSIIDAMQALDERRLLLEVNTKGIVQAVLSTSTPSSLFGFDPHWLKGKSLGEVVDVLQGEGGSRVAVEADLNIPTCCLIYPRPALTLYIL